MGPGVPTLAVSSWVLATTSNDFNANFSLGFPFVDPSMESAQL